MERRRRKESTVLAVLAGAEKRTFWSEKGTPQELILLLAMYHGSGAQGGFGVPIHTLWLQTECFNVAKKPETIPTLNFA